MKTYSRLCAVLFGLMMTILCIVITAETLLRKVFNFSLAGVDELSGYAIAIGAPLCFAIAAIEQSHIRINLLYTKLPRILKALMNISSVLLMAALSLYLALFTFRTVSETLLFGSVAQTPWMTPLIWPQTFWLISMIFFSLSTFWLAIRGIILVFKKDIDRLISDFGPDAIEDELATELSDLEARQ